MKKSLVARGITGIVASLLGVAAVGCSAEGGDYAETEVGETSQAVVLSPTLNTSTDVAFSGIARLGTTSKWISIGGYNVAGNAVATSVIFDASASSSSPDNRYLNLSAAIPTALGEVSIKQIDHTGSGSTEKYVFLVAGGRLVREGAGQTKTYILELTAGASSLFTSATWTEITTADGGSDQQLLTGAVLGHDEIKPCGTSGTKFLVAGGMTLKGMEDRGATMAATDAIQVFTWSGTPATSGWANLLDGSGNVVKLATDRGYKETQDVSVNDIRVFGGANNNAREAIDTVERIQVSDSCVANANLGTVDNVNHVVRYRLTLNNLPAPRARMDSIKKSVSINAGSPATANFIIAGGNDNTDNSPGRNAPTTIFYYNSTSDTYNTTKSLTVGRLFPLFADDTNQVQLVAGVKPDNAADVLMSDTDTTVDVLSTGTGVRSAGSALTQGRVGMFVTHVFGAGPNGYAGNGHKYLAGVISSPAAVQNVEKF